MRGDVDWLLLLLGLVGGFVVYELIGVDPRFKHIHSISYLAKTRRWFALMIGLAFIAGGILGALWWAHHLGTSILK